MCCTSQVQCIYKASPRPLGARGTVPGLLPLPGDGRPSAPPTQLSSTLLLSPPLPLPNQGMEGEEAVEAGRKAELGAPPPSINLLPEASVGLTDGAGPVFLGLQPSFPFPSVI